MGVFDKSNGPPQPPGQGQKMVNLTKPKPTPANSGKTYGPYSKNGQAGRPRPAAPSQPSGSAAGGGAFQKDPMVGSGRAKPRGKVGSGQAKKSPLSTAKHPGGSGNGGLSKYKGKK